MNKEEPLLSVIVPVYNAEQYIDECVKSILAQTYMEIEIILVDDGSSDRSGLICELLAEENTSIKVLHIDNGGITKARLTGLKASIAKWVTFVDADDWICEDAYKDLFFEYDCDVMITGICRYIDREHQIMQSPFLKERIYDKESIVNEIIPIMLWDSELENWALDPSLCTKVFKRHLVLEQLEKVSVVNSNYGEDSMVIYPLMLHVDRVQISKKIYYFHRQRISGEISPYIRDEEFVSKLCRVYEYLKLQFKNMSYWNIMKKQLDCFYINSINLKKNCYGYSNLKFIAHFPIEIISPNCNIVLYGAGNLGKQYWEQNNLYHFCQIKFWVDKNYKKFKDDNNSIQNPEIIRYVNFDYILIAMDDYYTAKEIVMYLKELGVDKKQIVWNSARVNTKEF